jgi:hypothetical protein
MGQGQSQPGGPPGGSGEQGKDQVGESVFIFQWSSLQQGLFGHCRQFRGSQQPVVAPASCFLSQEKKKKYEPPAPPPRVGRKQRRRDQGAGVAGAKLPTITPSAKCKLRLLKLERVKDYLLMEEEFVRNQVPLFCC